MHRFIFISMTRLFRDMQIPPPTCRQRRQSPPCLFAADNLVDVSCGGKKNKEKQERVKKINKGASLLLPWSDLAESGSHYIHQAGKSEPRSAVRDLKTKKEKKESPEIK